MPLMKIVHLFVLSLAICSIASVGCGPNTDTTVIEQEAPMTEDERADADAAYEASSNAGAQDNSAEN